MNFSAGVLICLASTTLALPSFQAKPTTRPPYDLAVTTVQTLSMARSAWVTLGGSKPGRARASGPQETNVAVRDAVNQLKEAGRLLEPFERASDLALRSGGKQLRSVCVALADTLTTPGKSDSDLDKTWRLLPLGIAAVTHSLLDGNRPVNGKIVYIHLTKSEQIQLVNSIRSTFPNARPQPGGNDPVEESVNLFLGFLSGDWKTADDR